MASPRLDDVHFQARRRASGRVTASSCSYHWVHERTAVPDPELPLKALRSVIVAPWIWTQV